ncbi:hypothetical protein [Salinispora pacifica]|uniref:hypothetical protein n=1 Tax=Salinispora pacifica TaxID=351187 RepID=UPI001E29834F|nr:hypothetical protein [Salinispora pacifica]
MRLVDLDRNAVTEWQIRETDDYTVMCQRNDPDRVLTACILFLRGDFESLNDAIVQAELQREVAHTAEQRLVDRAMMRWVPSGPVGESPTNNSFVNLITGEGEVNFSNRSAEMNCWEAVIVAAILNGDIVNTDTLRHLYTNGEPRNFTPTLVHHLAMERHVYNGAGPLLSRPVRGDVVMFSGLDHVVLATGRRVEAPAAREGHPEQSGGRQVISFWPAPFIKNFGPGTAATVSLTTVEGIHQWIREDGGNADVTFGCPNWRALR